MVPAVEIQRQQSRAHSLRERTMMTKGKSLPVWVSSMPDLPHSFWEDGCVLKASHRECLSPLGEGCEEL